jgi:hypothetical protein
MARLIDKIQPLNEKNAKLESEVITRDKEIHWHRE